jgi:hypothetical protein
MFTGRISVGRKFQRRCRYVASGLEQLEARQLLASLPVAIRDAYQGQALQPLVVAQYYVCCSPRQGGIVIFDNGVGLPSSTAGGLGTSYGGDTIVFGRDDLLVGYTNSISSFDFWFMRISDLGVEQIDSAPWGSMLSGFNIGRIEVAAGRVFTDQGQVVDLATRTPVGSFQGGENFLLDPAGGKLFSVATTRQTSTLYVYDIRTLDLLDQVDLPGITGSTASLVRYGADGVAFRTMVSNQPNAIYLVQSSAIWGVVPRGVLDNDLDVDVNGLQVELVTPPQHGTLSLGGRNVETNVLW